MQLNKQPIKYNFSSRHEVYPKYIVIHDTGNTSVAANAQAHYKYFNGAKRNASAHFFVDDKEIIETVEINLSAWHCGDGRGKYGITNRNSIGIEMCVNPDSDFNKTMENTIKLIRFLMKTYNIPKENVARHYDASRKICPRSLSQNNWESWWIFKEMI